MRRPREKGGLSMKPHTAMRLFTAALCATFLAACGGEGQAVSSEAQTSPLPTASFDATGDWPEKIAVLYADFSFGDADPAPGAIEQYEYAHAGELAGEKLAKGLCELTGLDFFVTISALPDGLKVDWSANSTLVAGLDEREQKEGFFFYDADSMRWFMMDSLWRTMTQNLDAENIYYTMDGGNELAFGDLEPVAAFPADIPYMGSPFYFAHSDVRGEESVNLYFDEVDGLALIYPIAFVAPGLLNSDAAMEFSALDGEETLTYWTLPNTYDETPEAYFERRASLAPYAIAWVGGDPASGKIVVSAVDTVGAANALRGCVQHVFVLPDRVAIAQIECAPEDLARWHDVALEEISIDEAAMGAGDAAWSAISAALSDRLASGLALMETGEEVIGGEKCATFALGTDTAEKFTAQEHYAVSPSGQIYVMDILAGGEYLLFFPR